MESIIESMAISDWPQVRRIYEEGIASGQSTFETEAPGWKQWHATHLPEPRLVVRAADHLLGWAALSPVSARKAYAGVAEVSVYVAAAHHGQRIGSALLERLVSDSDRLGLWMLQAGIFPENAASIALHLGCGFRIVGTRERIAKLHGQWRDVVLFERRSPIAGT